MDWLRKQLRSVKKRAKPVIIGAATGGPVGAVGGLLAGADATEGAELMEPVIAAVLAGQVTTGQALLAGGLAVVGILAGAVVGYVAGEDAGTD